MKKANNYNSQLIILFCLMFLTFVCSCTKSNASNVEVVKSMLGKEIIFPADLQCQILDTSFVYNIHDADYKIVTYIDSSGCTSCKMKLASWNKVLNEFHAHGNAELKFLMIIDTKEFNVVNFLLKSNEFYHPVSMNSGKEYKEINKLPQQSEYQTYLLDSENKIIAVGNPVLNPKIKDLYNNLIKEDLDHGSVGCRNLAVKPIKNIGLINKGEAVKVTYSLLNNDSITYRIEDIVPSCDCICIENKQDILSIGTMSNISIQFTSDTIGTMFHKYIDVFYKEKEYPERLITYGYLK